MTEMRMYIKSSKAFITKNKKLNKNKFKKKEQKCWIYENEERKKEPEREECG